MSNAALLLLDRSGSMSSCRDLIVDGINDFLKKLRGDATGRDATFELIEFDSLGFDTRRKGAVTNIKDLAKTEFEPRALTPLHDAVAHAIERLDEVPAKKRMLIIVTDGEENASKRFPQTSQIRSIIEAMQAKGWIIIYLAAHVDAWKQASQIGVPNERAMNFKAASASVQRPGFMGRVFGSRTNVNPFALALGAAAGLGVAVWAGNAIASALAFSEEDRNAAMGVDGISQTWQDAVQEDIAGFEEPMGGIFDLPSDLADEQASLPDDFDPTQGSLDENGDQPGAPADDLLTADDAAEHAGAVDEVVSDSGSTDDEGVRWTPSRDDDMPTPELVSDTSGGSSWFGGGGSDSSDSSSSWSDSGGGDSGGGGGSD